MCIWMLILRKVWLIVINGKEIVTFPCSCHAITGDMPISLFANNVLLPYPIILLAFQLAFQTKIL